uniref:uracil phosphoribosyltransferase n=1 Tax=Lithothamnion corallioides TaxID=1277934 RepID=UPI0023F0D6B2|nr:uracil phosphoribosyltransferase [Lithothamnion corallioides]WEA77111.1 uracil phosphoribosyltransferase [Lithothamnion corallioides]
MKLNIYTTSHPITQFLSSTVQNTKLQSHTKDHAWKQLGQFLIYETIRNWIKIYKLKIKQINMTKKFTILDPKESYIIMTNITMNLALIQEARDILPSCIISLIDFNKNHSSFLIDSNFSYIPKEIDQSTKILIVKTYINLEYFLQLMEYLINIKKINISHIRLICIICEENKLITISQKYPKLNIYTTQITNNLNIDPDNYLKKF